MKHGPKLLLIVTVLAIIASVTLPAVRIIQARNKGDSAARAAFGELRQQAISSILSADDISQEEWLNKAAMIWSSHKTLLAFFVKDSMGEVLYAMPGASPYYKKVSEGLIFERPEVSTVNYKTSLAEAMTLEALFVVLSQEDIFYPLRDTVIVLAALLLIITVGLVVNSSGKSIEHKTAPSKAVPDGHSGFSPGNSPQFGEAALYHEETEENLPELPMMPEKPLGEKTELEEKQTMEDSAVRPEISAPPAKEKFPGFIKPEDLKNGSIDGPRGLFDPESGLGWEAYLRDRLSEELKRSASFEQDLSLLITFFESSTRGEPGFNLFASIIQSFFSFKDMTFLFGSNGTASILPNMDAEHAVRMCEELQNKLSLSFPGPGAITFFGLSSRAGRLVDADRLIGETLAALNKAKKDKTTRILAFRPDPDRFRAYLAGS